MACFTTEHVLEKATYRKSCRIGDDIWMMDINTSWDISMRKFHTKTGTFDNIEHLVPNPLAWTCHSIFTSNSKLYMYICTMHNSYRLMEFDSLAFKWNGLMEFESQFNNTEFVMLDRTLYMTPGNKVMQILNLDTCQMASIELPRYNHEYHNYNICELNGSLYLIAVWRPGRKSVYQYDKDNNKFVDIKKKDRMLWAFEKYGIELPVIDTFVWCDNNKIFQAFEVHMKFFEYRTSGEYLVIDYFDMETEKWQTVFQSAYKRNVTNVIGGDDNTVYVISDNLVDVLIKKIDLDPNLESISLVQLADKSAINYYTDEPLTIELPFGLRSRYDNMIQWKVRKTALGLLNYHISLLEKFEVGKAENDQKRIQMDNEFKALPRILQRAEHFDRKRESVKIWFQLDEAQGTQVARFMQLRKEYKVKLKKQWIRVKDRQERRRIEHRAEILDGLSQRFSSWVKKSVSRPTI